MILFFDTETNGLPDWKADPFNEPDKWPWPVEIAWAGFLRRAFIKRDRLSTEPRFRQVCSGALLVQPNGWTIPPDAVAVHGITERMAMKQGTPLTEVLDEVVPLFGAASLVCGHNVEFDLHVVAAACVRSGKGELAEVIRKVASTCCTMRTTTDVCRIPHKSDRGYKWPTLSELCAELEVPYVDKHRAMPDVAATAECWFRLERKGFWHLKRQRPFGHSVRVVRAVRLAALGPLDPTYREETIEVKRRGSRKTLERAVRLVRGYIRTEGEMQEYTAQEWIRVFGSGNERGTCRGLVSV